MRGWAGPLVIFGELGLLGLALLVILGIAGVLLWLATQLWFLLLAATVLVAASWGYWRYRVTWSDGYEVHTCWRWELPLLPARQETGFILVPVTIQPQYCDECGSRLINGMCPICDGI